MATTATSAAPNKKGVFDPNKPLDEGKFATPETEISQTQGPDSLGAGASADGFTVNSTASPDPAGDQTSPATPTSPTEPATGGGGLVDTAAATPEVAPESPAPDGTPPAPTDGGIVDSAAPQTPATAGPEDGAWTAGGVDGIEQADTKDVTATGYTPAATPETKTYDPSTYEATGYVPETVKENMSQAVTRITDEDGVMMQRAAAAGERRAAGRGLINSTMAVQAAQAAVLDQAIPIAQGDIQTGMFNAQQANDAARFTADAKNRASEFAAAAANAAKQFGAGEANKMAMFAAEQFNMAARFAAEAENAAKQFNANAYNEARQKYVDAVNAAKAAQVDAENLSRRDAATFAQQRELQRMQGETARATANAGYNASIATANIRAQTEAAQLAAQREENRLSREARAAEVDTNTRLTIDQMGQGAFERYQAGMNALMTADMEPEARQNAIHNYNAMWSGNPYLPVTIDMSAFPAAGGP